MAENDDEDDMAILEDIDSPEDKSKESPAMSANDFFDTMSNSTLVVHAPRGNNRGRGRGDYRGGRGGYQDRGGRGGYNNDRGGYNNNRGGYNNYRGGGDNNNDRGLY